MTRVMVIGADGRVGSRVVEGIRTADDLEPAGLVEKDDDLEAMLREHEPEVAVDFTVPAAVFGNVQALLAAGVHAVVGTTGLKPAQLEELDARAHEAGVGVLVAPNFALGAVLMMRFAAEAARHYDWVEVVERHHEHKLDAPSGTAADTARRIGAVRDDVPRVEGESESAPGARGGRVEGVPVHSLRLPGSIAHQEVWFGGPGETLVIRHDSMDRAVFVPGVLLAVRAIAERRGLVRGLEPLLWPNG